MIFKEAIFNRLFEVISNEDHYFIFSLFHKNKHFFWILKATLYFFSKCE